MGHEEKLYELKNIRDQFTEGQSEAYAYAMMGENLFVTGGPGTGKSFLTKAIITGLECSGKSVLVMAPTGIAAVNVNGTTIHRALGLSKGEIIKENSLTLRGKKCPLLDKADVVVIDEISMVRMDMYEFIIKCIRSSERRTGNKIQLIVVGDFFQLPPVMLPDTRRLLEQYYKGPIGRAYCFESQEWKNSGFTTVILKTSIRQKDIEFIDALNQLRVGDKSCMMYLNHLSKKDDRFPYLVSTNNMAETLNRIKLDELRKKYNRAPHSFQLEWEGEIRVNELAVSKDIELYPGTRVMMVVNDPAGRYQNGSCGSVSGFGSKGMTRYVEVRLDNGKQVKVEPHTWKVTKTVVDEEDKIQQEECGSYTQLPLKLAYAITIHKSQGQTYDAVNIDPDCWEAAQLYVALSRVRTPEGVHLMNRILGQSIIVDSSVVKFYNSLTPNAEDDIEVPEQEIAQAAKNEASEPEPTVSEEESIPERKEKRTHAGRPSPFAEGTKRIRVGADSAEYIQEICKKQAMEGGKIRWLPDELDICVTDAFNNNIDFSAVTFMAVPLELEGLFRREIKKYEKRSDG